MYTYGEAIDYLSNGSQLKNFIDSNYDLDNELHQNIVADILAHYRTDYNQLLNN